MPKNRLSSPITDFVALSQDMEIFGELKWLLQSSPESSVPANKGPSILVQQEAYERPRLEITFRERLGLASWSQIQKNDGQLKTIGI